MLLDKIRSKFQFRLKDRSTAGSILATALIGNLKSREERQQSIVLGIPRGGVIVADIIAKKLSCEFDIIIPHKLRAPHNEEVAIGAIMEDGTTYLNEVIVKELEIPKEYIEKEKSQQLEEIKRRASLYRNNTLKEYYRIENRTVILADDGAATGATIIAAARWLRATKNPAHFIIAIPVAPKDTVNLLKRENIDHLEVITSPPASNFKSVGQYYQSFEPVTDEQVRQIMRKRNLL
ncbi:MAG TPA: phosphoribosyltransferase family protein [Nitrososphaeraceae archaeon]